jgi:hypothetical protein
MCFGTNSIRGIVNYSNSRENLPNSTIREYYSNSAICGEHCLRAISALHSASTGKLARATDSNHLTESGTWTDIKPQSPA